MNPGHPLDFGDLCEQEFLILVQVLHHHFEQVVGGLTGDLGSILGGVAR